MYIDSAKTAVNIAGEPLNRSGNNYQKKIGIISNSQPFGVDGKRILNVIDRHDDSNLYQKTTEALHHSESVSGTTHPLLKKELEGYSESNSYNSYVQFDYREYVSNAEKVYKITETSTVTIELNPFNDKFYTNARMKDDAYNITVWIEDINLNTVSSDINVLGNLEGIHILDELEIEVHGSIFDDVHN